MTAPVAPGRANGRRWTWWAFVTLELLAVVAVPLMALVGVRALLDTRAGTFVAGPERTDPGYQALVEPSPVLPLVERRDGVLTGITLLAWAGGDAQGGAAVLVPGELVVEDRTLAQWGEEGDGPAVDALSRTLRLALDEPVTVDEAGWDALLGDETVTVRAPDPVRVGGRQRFGAGELELDADDAADWLGLVGDQDPSALLFRRELWWDALLGAGAVAPDTDAVADPPGGSVRDTAEPPDPTGGELERSTDGEPAATIARIAAGAHVVEVLPAVPTDDGTMTVDPEAAESLLVQAVPVPAGSQPGDRLRVRLLDRTGGADLEAMARAVSLAGGEVVVIGNANAFDGLPTEAVIADASRDEPARRLLERIGTGTVTLVPGSDDSIDVTVLAGPDLLALIES